MTKADNLNGRDRKKRAGRPPTASYKVGSRRAILTVQENLVYIN